MLLVALQRYGIRFHREGPGVGYVHRTCIEPYIHIMIYSNLRRCIKAYEGRVPYPAILNRELVSAAASDGQHLSLVSKEAKA